MALAVMALPIFPILAINFMAMPILAINLMAQWETYGWIAMCVLATMTAVLINGIFMILAKSFNVHELEAFAKSEIYQAIATGVMAVGMVGLIAGSLSLAQTFIHGDLACGTGMHIGSTSSAVMNEAFTAIRCRLQATTRDVAGTQAALMTDANSTFGDFNLMGTSLSIFGIQVYRGDWNSATYRSTETIRMKNNLATVLLIGLNAQSTFVQYLQANMLQLFLPLGILLRSFYFTRGAGALFISIAIGMYFLFPVIYLLMDPGFVARPLPPPPAASIQPFCYATMSTTIKSLSAAQTTPEVALSPTSPSNNADLVQAYTALLLHPLVALFATLMVVRYMMSLLGGDTFELIKMVGKVV